MASAEFNFDTDVLPVVRELASRRFSRLSERDTLTWDAISQAWESFRRRPGKPPKSVAHYACRRVLVRRQFQESARSIDGPNPNRMAKAIRVNGFDLGSISRMRDDPADLAALRIDYPQWLATLSQRQLALLESFLNSDSTAELAERFGVSPGRISQIRRELVELWHEFTA